MASLNFNFDSLKNLHDSVNNLLHSPDTKLEILELGHEKYAHDISEASLKMADSCAAARDLLSLTKEHLQHLHSAFRRTAANDKNQNPNFSPYRVPRKQLKKAILKRLDSLKGMQKSSAVDDFCEDQSLLVVADLLREVRETTLSIVRSLMSLIAMPDLENNKKRELKRDAVFKLKLTRVDSLSGWERCHVSEVRAVAKRLEEVEGVVEELEDELECMFRRLIRTRASLLNIISR